jgi:hypothetical protein
VFPVFFSDFTFPIVTKASEESDRIPNGCKETLRFLRRGITLHGDGQVKAAGEVAKVNCCAAFALDFVFFGLIHTCCLNRNYCTN